MKGVVRKEVLKLLEACITYPTSDNSWVSPVHVIQKEGGMIVVWNKKNKLIPTRIVIGWCICIDYRRLNQVTRKYHFLLPFMDQMLERLEDQAYYYFIDSYSGYHQIVVEPTNQEKTSFTWPFWVFSYHKMPFALWNAPTIFQRCILSIFYMG